MAIAFFSSEYFFFCKRIKLCFYSSRQALSNGLCFCSKWWSEDDVDNDKRNILQLTMSEQKHTFQNIKLLLCKEDNWRNYFIITKGWEKLAAAIVHADKMQKLMKTDSQGTGCISISKDGLQKLALIRKQGEW